MVQRVAHAHKAVGYSDYDFIVIHSSRKTCRKLMVNVGAPDTATMKRMGQKHLESVKAYQKVCGVTGFA